MKKLGIGLLVGVGSVIGLVAIAVAVYLYAGTEYTTCYGVFKSKAAAEQAAEAGDDAGFDTATERLEDGEVGIYWAVDFDSGETGDDARELRRAFRDIVRRERGKLGHSGSGCLEKDTISAAALKGTFGG